MSIYKIPILFQSVDTIEVEADNLQQAITEALSIFFSKHDNNYIEDSFEIDGIIEDTYPSEDYDIELACKELNNLL